MSKAPRAPDPYQVSAAQTQSNIDTARETARLNAIDQSGPFGSTTYTRDATGVPTAQTVNLSPELQGWLNSQFGLSEGLSSAATNQLGNLPTTPFSLSSIPDTSQIAKTSYEKQLGLLSPQFEEEKRNLGVSLSERGIPVGSEVYNNEMDRYERAKGGALTQASRQAELDAGNEYQRTLSNALLERQQPFSELSAYMGANPNFQMPQFMNPAQTNVAGTDVSGNVWNAYRADAQNAANKSGQLWSGLMGLGQLGIGMLSDENMKEDREPADGEEVLMHFRRMPVDEYAYKPEAQGLFGVPPRRTGPMAGDYAREFGGDGHTIDLGDMVGRLAAAVKALDARTAGGRGGMMMAA